MVADALSPEIDLHRHPAQELGEAEEVIDRLDPASLGVRHVILLLQDGAASVGDNECPVVVGQRNSDHEL